MRGSDTTDHGVLSVVISIKVVRVYRTSVQNYLVRLGPSLSFNWVMILMTVVIKKKKSAFPCNDCVLT